MYFRFHNKIPYEKTLLFTKDLFSLTGKLPDYERAGVIKQMRAMGSSVLQDVAESYVTKSKDESQRSLDRSLKTIAKIVSMLDLCRNLGYIISPTHHSWLIACESLSKELEDVRKSP